MTVRRLHIGARQRHDGWETLDVNPAPHIDHVCDARDLSRFSDEVFEELYASHVLEHFDYRKELHSVLVEWRRVLVPGGLLMVSVPDIDTLSRLMLRSDLGFTERFEVMRMMFGGHVDRYDYHVAGLNEQFLCHFLGQAGFDNIRRVDSFDLFDDTSTLVFKGEAISLNVIAEKP